MTFNLLHVHSHFSVYDGFGSPMAMAKQAKKLGMNALALTDHGTMGGCVEHISACKEHGIKPILGMEAYFQPVFNKGSDENKERKKKGEKPVRAKRYHMTLLASSKKGYQSLTRALEYSLAQGKYYFNPVFDYEVLEKFHEDVICLSGCPAGFFSSMVMSGDSDLDMHIKHFLQIFEDRFFFEVMPHHFRFNESAADGEATDENVFDTGILNQRIIDIANIYNRPVVMTTDSHYQRQSQYSSYLVMHKLRNHEFTNDYTHLYFTTEDEASYWWSEFMDDDAQQHIDATQVVADMCDINLDFKEMVPKLDWGTEETSDERLTELAIDGMKKLGITSKVYKQRMKKELDVVIEKGYSDYFLLCHDIVQHAKSKDIAVGFGRGSVCGSLLAYAIGLTLVDPIRFDIVFERFLRPNRTTMPDIDMDFCTVRRGEIINYIIHQFSGSSAPIVAYGYYKVLNLCNDLAKLFQLPGDIAESFKHELEVRIHDNGDSDTIKRASYKQLMRSKSLQQIDAKYGEKYNGKWYGIVKHFSALYGQIRFIGQHAAGVAVTSGSIGDFVPLAFSRGKLITSFDKDSLGLLNIVKMDVLGLSTATVVHEASRITRTQFSYDLLDDPEVFQRFKEGNTSGIFQFESRGARDVLRQVKPDNIEELIACTALNRPAPKELGLVEMYAKSKNGILTPKKSVWQEYVKETHGAIIYQEQVMTICREMACMDWPDIDKVLKHLRSAVEENDPLRDKFVEGACAHTSISKQEAVRLFNAMTMYLFNKGHGAGYTLISYYQMWLKVHYPLEFFFSIIKYEDDESKRLSLEAEAVHNGIVIFPPSINSDIGYTLRGKGDDRYIERGLKVIPHVGPTTAKAIVEERRMNGDYAGESEAAFRLPQRVLNVGVISTLNQHRAFEVDFEKRCQLAVELCQSLARLRR